jgi:hypothetical protein
MDSAESIQNNWKTDVGWIRDERCYTRRTIIQKIPFGGFTTRPCTTSFGFSTMPMGVSPTFTKRHAPPSQSKVDL